MSYHVSYSSLAQPPRMHNVDRLPGGMCGEAIGHGEGSSLIVSHLVTVRGEEFSLVQPPGTFLSQQDSMASIVLPPPPKSRLSLYLTTSFSLAPEIQSLVEDPLTPSHPVSAQSTIIPDIRQDETHKPNEMRLSQADYVDALTARIRRLSDIPVPAAPKQDHVAVFTLPPLLESGSPVFSDITTSWIRPSSFGALLDELRLDAIVRKGPHLPGPAQSALRDTKSHATLSSGLSDGNMTLDFNRFSVCAFQGSSPSIASTLDGRANHSGLVTVTEPLPVARMDFRSKALAMSPRLVEENGAMKGEHAPSYKTHAGKHIEPSFSLPPWDKLELLSLRHSEEASTCRAAGGFDGGDHVLRVMEQPSNLRTIEGGEEIPDTPEFFFRGIRSQVFDSPSIPFAFGTPATDDEQGNTPQQTSQNVMASRIIGTTPPAHGFVPNMDAPSLPSTPRQPSAANTTESITERNGDEFHFLVHSPSSSFMAVSPFRLSATDNSLDDFTQEILQLVQSGGLTSDSLGLTPSASESSLSRALVGIGLNLLEGQTPSSSETSLAQWRLSRSSLATKRYIASRLSRHLEQADLLWSSFGDEESVVAKQSVMADQPPVIVVGTVEEDAAQDASLVLDGPTVDRMEALPQEAQPSLHGTPDSAIGGHLEVSNPNEATILKRESSTASTEPITSPKSSPEPTVQTSQVSNERFEEPTTKTRAHPRRPCPPLVVVTSPTLGMCFRRFGLTIESVMGEEDPSYNSDSDSGSEYASSSSGSDFHFGATADSSGKRKRRDVAIYSSDDSAPSSASSSTGTFSLASSTSSLASTPTITKIPISSRSTMPRSVLVSPPVVDFTEEGKHTVQVVHRPLRQHTVGMDSAHATATVVRRYRSGSEVSAAGIVGLIGSGIPRYQKSGGQSNQVQPAVHDAASSSPTRDDKSWLRCLGGGSLLEETFPGSEESI